ncbi:hypothetical protein O6H91_07G107000 [Diphasiastrum complanatum]|uniref:Uncharacterized protein n=1 Tax=Diphasiastrum complanatum TaxID=34168 RepID=A0ACC2D8I1_DIPCM|nr:hypothetical protein O6H91_07G107000 [Diphasiastrum complanatum]
MVAQSLSDTGAAVSRHTQMEELKVVWSAHQSRFQTSDGLAFLAYELRSSSDGKHRSKTTREVMDLQLAFVPPGQRGLGVAEMLCDFAFVFAKENGWRVMPTCSYVVNSFLPRHPEWKELVNPGFLKPDWYESGSQVELVSFGPDACNPLLLSKL